MCFIVDFIVFVVYNRDMYEIFNEQNQSIDLVDESMLELLREKGEIKPNYKIYNTLTGERIK